VGKVSAVINVVEEEIGVLPRALASVKNLVDEIVLVDMTSSGKLFQATKEYGVKIIKHDRVPYVEVVRNFGISKVSNEWVLILDPDEEISSNLQRIIKDLIESGGADYYRLPRKNIIFGKWIKHSRWWPDYNIRLFKKGNVSWNEIIHTVPTTIGTGRDLDVKEENALVHYHYESLEQYVERMNRYTTAYAKNLIEGGYKFEWRDLIHKPVGEFFSRYFQGEGYRDGLHGLVLAGLQAFSELITYLKIWQKGKFENYHADIEEITKEMKEVESDFHYWQADALLKEVGGIKHRIKRKFRLS
jgi:(heptosyl)LPS beta-1,4-glucosyltransferase